MTLTELAIKRPSFIVVIFSVLSLLGIFGYSHLKYELLPKITPPVISIVTVYPGASPAEVESQVTKKVEDAISSLDKVATVRSTSSEGASFVVVEFSHSADIDLCLQDAQRKVNQIISTLPDEVKNPTLLKFALDEMPILRMGVTANEEARTFYQFVKDQLQPRLNKVSGVGQITLVGGEEREIKINLDAEKLKAYRVSVMQIVQAVSSANVEIPAGNVKTADNQFTVRLAGKVKNVMDLQELIVARSPMTGGEVRLRDVAEVFDGQKDYDKINRINGKTSIGLLIQKQNDANAVETARLVREEITRLETEYKSKQLHIDVAQDTTAYTIEAADAVKHDLMLAIGLVALVMLLFLHSLRNSLIVMVSIPASLVSTFLAMWILDYSLNLMTLLALSLVIGILVDDSIVVLENIYRHLEMGKKSRRASLDGRNEIGFTALAITLVDVVVFLPLAFVGGMIQNIMREFSIVIVVATLMSLFVSFTITPMLASRFSRYQEINKKTPWGAFAWAFESAFKWIIDEYAKVLHWALRKWYNKIVVIVATIAMFIGSLALVGGGYIGGEFISVADRSEFSVELESPPGTTIERHNLLTQQIEQDLMKLPEVKRVLVNVGQSSEGLLNTGQSNITDMTVTLVHKSERALSTAAFANVVRQKLHEYPGLRYSVRNIGIFGSADEAPIQVILTGVNRDDLNAATQKVMHTIENISGTADVKMTAEDGKPELSVDLDKVKMAKYGVTVADVAVTLRAALTGYDDSKFREAETDYSMRIALDPADRKTPSNLAQLTFVNMMGQTVELGQFATITQSSGPTKMERTDRLSSIMIKAQAIGRPSGDIGAEIKTKINALKLPPGIEWRFFGQLKNQDDAGKSMGIAFLASIIFEYLIMVALYDSYIYPFVVLFSIPVAIVGAFLGLALSMQTLNIFTGLGLIMLVGLVGKNAILLVDFTNQGRTHGLPTFEALIEAGRERLRPIVMTTIAMALGMLPIALATGAGAEWKKGLAWALIGGLMSSMLLTLVVVPVVYSVFDGIISRVYRLFGIKPQFHKEEDDDYTPPPNGHENGYAGNGAAKHEVDTRTVAAPV